MPVFQKIKCYVEAWKNSMCDHDTRYHHQILTIILLHDIRIKFANQTAQIRNMTNTSLHNSIPEHLLRDGSHTVRHGWRKDRMEDPARKQIQAIQARLDKKHNDIGKRKETTIQLMTMNEYKTQHH